MNWTQTLAYKFWRDFRPQKLEVWVSLTRFAGANSPLVVLVWNEGDADFLVKEQVWLMLLLSKFYPRESNSDKLHAAVTTVFSIKVTRKDSSV